MKDNHHHHHVVVWFLTLHQPLDQNLLCIQAAVQPAPSGPEEDPAGQVLVPFRTSQWCKTAGSYWAYQEA